LFFILVTSMKIEAQDIRARDLGIPLNGTPGDLNTITDVKGGIGTSSRKVTVGSRVYTIGVLVQANYGTRESLTIAGVPVGKEIPDLLPDINPLKKNEDHGSIIVVVATDAPLLPHQLKRLARRVPIGINS